jgi:hypothetical protein
MEILPLLRESLLFKFLSTKFRKLPCLKELYPLANFAERRHI